MRGRNLLSWVGCTVAVGVGVSVVEETGKVGVAVGVAVDVAVATSLWTVTETVSR